MSLSKLLGIAQGAISGGQGAGMLGAGSTGGAILGGGIAAAGDSAGGQAGRIIGSVDAMSRRSEANANQPHMLVNQTLKQLEDPDVANSLPYETYASVIEPLLRAKYFGKGGGLPAQEDQGQGKINPVKKDSGGGLGLVAGAAQLAKFL